MATTMMMISAKRHRIQLTMSYLWHNSNRALNRELSPSVECATLLYVDRKISISRVVFTFPLSSTDSFIIIIQTNPFVHSLQISGQAKNNGDVHCADSFSFLIDCFLRTILLFVWPSVEHLPFQLCIHTIVLRSFKYFYP